MLYTTDKIATPKLALQWFAKFHEDKLIKPTEIVLVCGYNRYDGLNYDFTNFRFHRDYVERMNQIVVKGKYKNYPVTITLIIENLQNRILIEADDVTIEQKLSEKLKLEKLYKS